jgi:hypothetical protein
MRAQQIILFASLSFSLASYSADECINCELSKVQAVSKDAVDLSNKLLSALPRNKNVDYDFLAKVKNKAFMYVRPKVNDSEPNCVATALRAGNYLPAFALSGTDNFYEGILPYCFSKKVEGTPASGDLGILYFREGNFGTLGHMFLFLDEKNIFEKPGPQNDQLFQMSTLEKVKQSSISSTLEIWSYAPKKNCPLVLINKEFAAQPENSLLKRVSREIEERISSGDWTSPTTAFKKGELEEFQQLHEKKISKWMRSLPGGYKLERDQPKMLELFFPLEIIKTALRIPITR